MIHCFDKLSLFLMAVFFVFCKNNGMNALIPYEFCGKMIKKNPAYEKIPTNQQDNILPNDIYFEIGQCMVGSNTCDNILRSWFNRYSHNQYIIFIHYTAKIAKKTKLEPSLILYIIDETSKENLVNDKQECDFCAGVQLVKLYQSILYKIEKPHKRILSVDEFDFLNSKLGNNLIALVNGTKLKVERTFLERLDIKPDQLILNFWGATSINLIACFFLELGVTLAQTMTSEEFEKADLNDFGIVNVRFLKYSEMLFLALKAYWLYVENNYPIEKMYTYNNHQ